MRSLKGTFDWDALGLTDAPMALEKLIKAIREQYGCSFEDAKKKLDEE